MTFDPIAAGWKQRHGQGPFTQLVGPIYAKRVSCRHPRLP